MFPLPLTYLGIDMNIQRALLPILALVLFVCGTAQSQTYYVATNGNDGRNQGQATNRNTPWRTIQRALNLAGSGSTIIVLDGRYFTHANFIRSNVTLRSERKEGAFIEGSITGEDLSFLTIDGFEIANFREDAPQSKGVQINRCHNITVRDCRVHDCRGGGISIDQSDQILCEWNIVYRNAFWNPDQHSGISIYQPQQRTADRPGYDLSLIHI